MEELPCNGRSLVIAFYALPAVRADTFDGWFAVLERDVLGVLDFDVCFAFYAVCLGHFSFNWGGVHLVLV